jgi:hypothetical protein
MNKIKVLVVDDSAVVRQVAEEILSADPGIEVVGIAAGAVSIITKPKLGLKQFRSTASFHSTAFPEKSSLMATNRWLSPGIARTQTYGTNRCRIPTIDAQQHAET